MLPQSMRKLLALIVAVVLGLILLDWLASQAPQAVEAARRQSARVPMFESTESELS